MELTAEVVERAVAAYPDRQPLATVETEHLDLLPDMLADGDYGWRDPEWIVQWYFRRFLGAYPDADRRAAEAAYGENSYDAVHDAIDAALAADDAAAKLDQLTDLEGIDVPVGSAFLQFMHPADYLAVDGHAWSVLHEATELDRPYPDPPAIQDYEAFLAACRTVADRCDCPLWDLYRTLWMLGQE